LEGATLEGLVRFGHNKKEGWPGISGQPLIYFKRMKTPD
jgi:hypothetical protein